MIYVSSCVVALRLSNYPADWEAMALDVFRNKILDYKRDKYFHHKHFRSLNIRLCYKCSIIILFLFFIWFKNMNFFINRFYMLYTFETLIYKHIYFRRVSLEKDYSVLYHRWRMPYCNDWKFRINLVTRKIFRIARIQWNVHGFSHSYSYEKTALLYGG